MPTIYLKLWKTSGVSTESLAVHKPASLHHRPVHVSAIAAYTIVTADVATITVAAAALTTAALTTITTAAVATSTFTSTTISTTS